MRKINNDELGRKNVSEFKSATKIPLIIVLDNVRSLHNVGSVFRTADAFICEAIYLCGITAAPPHREIEKTALGATESVAWKYFKTTLEAVAELKTQQYELIAVEQAEGGEELGDFSPSPGKKLAVIFGHEMFGVSDEVMQQVDKAIEISQYGTKHSLNISVCAGIV
ncbi:MAG: RNA methyltransferase, partial [Bacteroidota bacterium]